MNIAPINEDISRAADVGRDDIKNAIDTPPYIIIDPKSSINPQPNSSNITTPVTVRNTLATVKSISRDLAGT